MLIIAVNMITLLQGTMTASSLFLITIYLNYSTLNSLIIGDEKVV